MTDTPSSRSRRGLRLPIFRRPDPVITEDELRFVATLLNAHIDWAAREMDGRRVSESVIRNRMYAESVLMKVQEALRR